MNYILDGHKVIEEPDISKWAQWFQVGDRVVKKTTLQDKEGISVKISTVFLGLDHSFSDGPPLLFETMVFGGELDQEMDRCTTWDEAVIMHGLMCDKAKYSIK